MKRLSFVCLFGTILFAGCTKNNDLSFPSASPGLDQVMNTQTQPSLQPTATAIPTILPSPSLIPQVTESATVSAKQTDVLVNLVTSKGTIKLKLYQTDAPNTVANFLAKGKSRFYNGLTFHRVESWVIQGGDPQGTGRGGGTMPTELNQQPFKVGSLGVARGGDIKVSNDSQFFICTDDCSWLTGAYTNFGEVVSGMEVAKQITVGDKITSVSRD